MLALSMYLGFLIFPPGGLKATRAAATAPTKLSRIKVFMCYFLRVQIYFRIKSCFFIERLMSAIGLLNMHLFDGVTINRQLSIACLPQQLTINQ
jgi:hypothetical protein